MNSTESIRKPLLKRTSIRLLLLFVIVIAIGAGVFRGEAPVLRSSGESMKAIVYQEYGAPDVLSYANTDRPLPDDDQVLMRVIAAGANPYDWHFIRGTPYIMRLMGSGLLKPVDPRVGVDVAGEIAAVGKDVTEFKVGDRVYGAATGSFAEYALAYPRHIAEIPANISPEQAAGIAIAGLTALQGLRDIGELEAGQKVLINGASGGVGTFAVQIAKAMGAEVTGVSSGRNHELVRSLGADHMIDYKKENFTENTKKYDLILDNVANHSLSALRSVLEPNGKLVLVGGGGPHDGLWIGPLINPIKALIYSPFIDQKMVTMMGSLNADDLRALNTLMEAGKMTPVIDRTYALEDTAEAIRYLETGRARAKVIIKVTNSDSRENEILIGEGSPLGTFWALPNS